MMDTVNVMLVEDHHVVREGFKKILELESNIKVVTEAGTCEETMQNIHSDLDIIFIDIKLPDGDGLELCREISRTLPGVKYIALTTYDDPVFVKKALEYGVHGFIPKHASFDEIKAAINAVLKHGKYLYPGLDTESTLTESGLEEIELEILSLIASGEKQSDIASQMFMSLSTLRRRLRGICTKLGVKTTEEAVARAAKKGLI